MLVPSHGHVRGVTTQVGIQLRAPLRLQGGETGIVEYRRQLDEVTVGVDHRMVELGPRISDALVMVTSPP